MVWYVERARGILCFATGEVDNQPQLCNLVKCYVLAKAIVLYSVYLWSLLCTVYLWSCRKIFYFFQDKLIAFLTLSHWGFSNIYWFSFTKKVLRWFSSYSWTCVSITRKTWSLIFFLVRLQLCMEKLLLCMLIPILTKWSGGLHALGYKYI